MNARAARTLSTLTLGLLLVAGVATAARAGTVATRSCLVSRVFGLVGAAFADTLHFRPVPPESADLIDTRPGHRGHASASTPPEPEPPTPAPSAPLPPIVERSGDVMRVGQDIVIGKDEVVRGDVSALKGNVTVEGHVEGSVVAVLGDVSLGPNAVVDGDVVCMKGQLHEEPGAVVRGQRVTALGGGEVHEGSRRWREHARAGARMLGSMIAFLIWFGILWLVARLAPARTAVALEGLVAGPMSSFGTGLIILALLIPSLVALALVMALLCITIIGIPLALALILAYALFVLALAVWGYIVGAASLGRWIDLRSGHASGSIVRRVTIGVLIISGGALVASLFIHSGLPGIHGLGVLICVLSWIAFSLVTVAGAGAWLRSEWKTGILGRWWQGRRRIGAPAAAAAAPASPAPPPPPPPPAPPESYAPPGLHDPPPTEPPAGS